MKKWLNSTKSALSVLMALLLVLTMLPLGAFAEDTTSDDESDWVTFILQCNEGMSNTGANVGNTMMVVSMNSDTGKIRMMMFTWDTFIDYPGYDVPQKIDMAFRNNGPEETVRVFNENFDLDIDLFMSLNYSNLASLIDSFDGVNIEISRAERNALNSMVGSKKDALKAQVDAGTLSQVLVELLSQEYYLEDFGPDTHLNGLQAVGYGWLQYDSVYNCCLREAKVISNLFESLAVQFAEKVVFYTDATDYPENVAGRRVINLDQLTDSDVVFLRNLVDPLFQMSYNNLSEEDILNMTVALAYNAYEATRQGVDIFQSVEYAVFPLEALDDYVVVAGSEGHVVDKEANTAAMKEFLYSED